MHDTCDECGLKFEIEPGFFYGSMYVSYGFSVGIFLTAWFVLTFFFDSPSVMTYIVVVVIAAALTYPFNVRLSRMIMLHVFGGVKYDPNYRKK